MRRSTAVVLAIALLGCTSPNASQDFDPSAFCTLPGSSVDELIANCKTAKLVMQDTEEGPLPAYEITYGKYRYLAEVDSGRVDLIRFMSDPLPISDLAIGDEFARVRLRYQEYKLLAGAEEGGYISIFDESRGLYLSFDISAVSTDWYFAGKQHDESAIAAIRLKSVNFTQITGSKKAQEGQRKGVREH